MSVVALCLAAGCGVSVLLIVGGTFFLSRRFFGTIEDDDWEELDDLPELERRS